MIIGPRSALFVPFPNLGMILIDEEHETSYKSETSPKYHARETAEELARLSGAMVVLGSATPSLEAYSRAKSGQYQLFTLKERLTGGTLPAVEVADLREELRQGCLLYTSYWEALHKAPSPSRPRSRPQKPLPHGLPYTAPS